MELEEKIGIMELVKLVFEGYEFKRPIPEASKCGPNISILI
jgi:hypothetical protein